MFFLAAILTCGAPFGDHMVLQRDRPVPVWGEASPGAGVIVRFAGQTARAEADAQGHWAATLAPLAASAQSREMTVDEDGEGRLAFTDVVVGEVWLCSGQSNMEKPLGPRPGQRPTDNYQAEIAQASHPLLRLFQEPKFGRLKAGGSDGRWWLCSPQSLAETKFSAVGYYFGRDLSAALGVPVGIVHSSFGGTQIEAWIPRSGFDRPDLRPLLGQPYFAWVKGVQATELYRSMIAPLAPYALRGFLWYQGEANVMEGDGPIYAEKMRALIEAWRSAWHEPHAAFDYVLLAPFDYSRWDKFPAKLTPLELPVFWQAQAEALSLQDTGMVAITDLVTNRHDIHPTHKREVGGRLANLALEKTYGRRGLLAENPTLADAQPQPPGAFALTFAHAGSGLASRDGKPLADFAAAGPDRRFFPAEARVEGDRVIVTCGAVPDPVAVRFGWNETADPNLVNSAGLPAVPFRTDAWPVVTLRQGPSAVGP